MGSSKCLMLVPILPVGDGDDDEQYPVTLALSKYTGLSVPDCHAMLEFFAELNIYLEQL
jgi:hypothetical protein